MDIINTLGYSLQTTQSTIMAFIAKTRVDVNLTGQTIILEFGLNRKFDPDQKRIYIKHSDLNLQYVWFEDEPEPVQYLFSQAEWDAQVEADKEYIFFYGENPLGIDADFQVVYPTALGTRKEEMIAFVNAYRQAGKLFTTATA